MRVAIYDLDKTLVRRATFTPFLMYAARRIAPWRLPLAPVWVGAMLGYKAGFYDRTALKTFGMRLMTGGASIEELARIGDAFAVHHLDRCGWIAPVKRILEDDRAEGATIAIATAAFEFYAYAFARLLGVDHVIATRWDGEGIPGGNCYGAHKRRRVEGWLAEEGLSGAEMRFVSDSFADTPMFDLASEPIFVATRKSELARAESRGWRGLLI